MQASFQSRLLCFAADNIPKIVACLLREAKSQDCLKHDQTGREEVEAHCTVAVVPQEGHEEAKSNKDHDRHLQHGVWMVWEGKVIGGKDQI